MAEFCPDCWNRLNGFKDGEKKYIVSMGLDLCEGCGELKHVIITEQENYYMYNYSLVVLFFKLVYYAFCILLKLVKLPYLIYKHYKSKK
jgi:hypothetical protein